MREFLEGLGADLRDVSQVYMTDSLRGGLRTS